MYDRFTHPNLNDLSSIKDDEALFFIRHSGKDHYFQFAYPKAYLDLFKSVTTYRTISEYACGDVVIDSSQYDLADLTYNDHMIIKRAIDVGDIIARCRGLRAISYHEAKELIYKTAKYFIDYFEAHPQLKVITLGIVDNYVMDVMVRVAEQFKITCNGFCYFFVQGYSRMNLYGEYNAIRDVDEQEVDDVLNTLKTRPTSRLSYNTKRLKKRWILDYISYKYRYLFRYLIGHKLLGKMTYEHRFAPYFQNFHQIKKIFSSRFFDPFIPSEIDSKNSVLIPLHYHPEANVDYWVDEADKADYMYSLLEAIRFFESKNITVYFKEHPTFHLRRPVEFYKQLKSFKNVKLLSPFISPWDLYDVIDNIAVWTGSSGIEAAIIGKHVVTFSKNFYTGDAYDFIPHYTDFDKNIRMDDKKTRDFVRYIMACTFKRDTSEKTLMS